MKRPPSPGAFVIQIQTLVRTRLQTALRDPRTRVRAEVGLASAIAVGLLLSIALLSGIATPADLYLSDLVYQPFSPSGQVVIIAIDQKSIDDLGPFPWNRTVYAELVERLSAASPRVVAFDLLFPQSTPEDAGFAASIGKPADVLLAAVGVEAAAFPLKRNTVPQFDVLLLPSPLLRQAASGVGHRMLTPDRDGILRRVPVAIGAANDPYPALGLAAAMRYLGVSNPEYDLDHGRVNVGKRHIEVDEYGRMLIDFSRVDGTTVFSFSDVFRGNVPTSTFAGKLVLIGGTSSSEPDTYDTALFGQDRDTYNVQIQADLADMLVSEPPHLLRAQDPLDRVAIVILFSLLAGVTLPHLRPTYSIALTIIYVLALFLGALYAFAGGLVVRVLYPALALVLTLLIVGSFRYASEERRRNFLTALFRRYVPAESVGRVVDAIDRGELPLGGARRIVTVLYADLRGFSGLSEGLAPETVLELVNRYLDLMMREILEEHGTVSKPMGDALIAIWNAPLDQPDHALRAAHTALAIHRRLAQLQDANAEGQSLNLGMGLATGWGILGNINLLGKVEYTLIGETVNVASRIGAYAGNNQIVVDEATVKALPADIEVREQSPIRVRGRKEPLAIWELSDPMEGLIEEEGFEA